MHGSHHCVIRRRDVSYRGCHREAERSLEAHRCGRRIKSAPGRAELSAMWLIGSGMAARFRRDRMSEVANSWASKCACSGGVVGLAADLV